MDQAYVRVAEAMTRAGQVYHAVIEADATVGEDTRSSTLEYWVDVGADSARLGDAEVIAHGVRYTGGPPTPSLNKSPAYSCHGANSAVSALLDCKGENELSSTLEEGQYEGNSAVVIASDIHISYEDATSTYKRRLYLDRNTFLPLAMEDNGTFESDQVEPLHALARYRSDFVSADSLQQGFFAPSSIGYVERDPLEPLNRPDFGLTVYWLGEKFSPGAGLPDLEVAGVEVPSCDFGDSSQPTKSGFSCGPGYKFILSYRASGDEFGPPLVMIQEWVPADWDAAQIQGDFSRVKIVRFPQTLAFVAGSGSPFDNASALEAVSAALKPRQ